MVGSFLEPKMTGTRVKMIKGSGSPIPNTAVFYEVNGYKPAWQQKGRKTVSCRNSTYFNFLCASPHGDNCQTLGCGCMFKRRGTSFGYDRCEDKYRYDTGFELCGGAIFFVPPCGTICQQGTSTRAYQAMGGLR